MLRLAPLIILFATPTLAFDSFAPFNCTLKLTDCDMSRMDCPADITATASLEAQGEETLLHTVGVNNIADPTGRNAETFVLFVETTEPVRTYFIALHDTVDGSFTHDAEGNANMHVVIQDQGEVYEEYFSGTCVNPA
jgi:hypothetical protein